MTTVSGDLRDPGLRPGAGEPTTPARAWLRAARPALRPLHRRRVARSRDGETFDVDNPATGETLARDRRRHAPPMSTPPWRPRARRFPAWAALGGYARARYLYALARLVQKHARLFAVLETWTTASRSARAATSTSRWSRGTSTTTPAGPSMLDARVPGHGAAMASCGQIIPWNFPLLMLAWKIAPGARRRQHRGAEARRVHLAHRAAVRRDLPTRSGCRRASSTSSPATATPARRIVDHPDIDKIAFTGSTEVGRIIRAATAGTGKKLSLELGGKSPFIVFDDADLDSAVEGLVDAIWFNQGQVCCAGSRLLVQEGIAERFIAKLQARMETLRVGDPLDKADRHRRAWSRRCSSSASRELVEAGRRRGRDAAGSPTCGLPEDGCFYPADADHRRRARHRPSRRRRSSGRCWSR